MCRRANNRLPLLPALEFSVADQSSIGVLQVLLGVSSSAPVVLVLTPAVHGPSIRRELRWAVLAVPVARDNGLALEPGRASAELDLDLADLAQGRVVLHLRPRRDARNAPPHADADADSNSIQRPKKAR